MQKRALPAGFELDAWDYIALGSFAVIGLGGLGLVALILGLPKLQDRAPLAAAGRPPSAGPSMQ